MVNMFISKIGKNMFDLNVLTSRGLAPKQKQLHVVCAWKERYKNKRHETSILASHKTICRVEKESFIF